MKEKKFMDKYGWLVVIGGLLVVLMLLKLIGFPEFLYS